MGASRAAALLLLLALGGVGAPSCAAVIGVSADYKDAAEELCECEDLARYYPDCVERVTRRLEGNPDEATKWIADFSKSCVCDKVGECARRRPLCMTCSEFIENFDDFIVMCDSSSEEITEGLFACLCSTCMQQCDNGVVKHFLCHGPDVVSACQQCMEDTGLATCTAEVQACLTDKPR